MFRNEYVLDCDIREMNDMQRFKNKQIVYVNSTYNIAEKCEVIDYVEYESSTGKSIYKVHSIVHKGTFGATEDCIFTTEEKARKAYEKSFEDLVKQYKDKIKTLKDLLEFPLSHCLSCGEEYIEYEAQKAYRIRANELTGLILDKE